MYFERKINEELQPNASADARQCKISWYLAPQSVTLGVSGKRRDLMGMPKAEIAALLVGLGFTLKSSSGFGEEYSFPLATGWKVTAYASFEGNAFAGTAKPDEFDEVSFTVDSKGTKHKCLSVAALKANAKRSLRNCSASHSMKTSCDARSVESDTYMPKSPSRFKSGSRSYPAKG
jgi:hypothetical protein